MKALIERLVASGTPMWRKTMSVQRASMPDYGRLANRSLER